MSKTFDSLARANAIQQTPAESAADLNGKTSSKGTIGEIMRRLPLRIPAGSPTFPFDGSHPDASEKYRMVRTKLMHHLKRPRILVISSAGPRDGKTTTTINLAAVSALRGEARILMIDGDIRRPSMATQLGFPDGPGLADVLAGDCQLEDALIQTEQIPNLHVLVAGECQSNPSELLASASWQALLTRCSQSYNYIFIDTPPMAAVADYELIQATCDGIIMVIRQDQTKRRSSLQALAHIPKEKLIGVVINSISPWPLDGGHGADVYYTTYANPPKVRVGKSEAR